MYDTSETIDLENAPLNGGILVKVLVLSIDPYLRRMMVGPDVQNFSVSRTPFSSRDNQSNLTSRQPPFELGQPYVEQPLSRYFA